MPTGGGPAEMDKPLGSRYRIGELIGRGGMGAVHRGCSTDGAPVAIKVIRPELATDQDVVTRFVRERSILTGVRDPHLVAVHDLVVEGDTLAIVMDLVEGTDLRKALAASGTFPPAEVARIGAGVACALGAAHDQGVLHRDVKPENVLLDQSGDPPVVRLADFGIARLVGDSVVSRVTGLIGTPNYLPPEVYAGGPASPATDLYALGVLLYELSCGVPPFTGDMVAVMAGHVGVMPGRPPDVPDRLWEITERLLAKDPAARPSGSREISAALSALSKDLHGAPAAALLDHPPPGEAIAPLPWLQPGWDGSVETGWGEQQGSAAKAGRMPLPSRLVRPVLALSIALVAGAGLTLLVVDRPGAASTVAQAKVVCASGVLSNGCGTQVDIERVQARLVELCYYERNDSAQIDGDYGAGTEAAVKRFQLANGLEPDGRVSSRTSYLLLGEVAKSACRVSDAL